MVLMRMQLSAWSIWSARPPPRSQVVVSTEPLASRRQRAAGTDLAQVFVHERQPPVDDGAVGAQAASVLQHRERGLGAAVDKEAARQVQQREGEVALRLRLRVHGPVGWVGRRAHKMGRMP